MDSGTILVLVCLGVIAIVFAGWYLSRRSQRNRRDEDQMDGTDVTGDFLLTGMLLSETESRAETGDTDSGGHDGGFDSGGFDSGGFDGGGFE